LCIVRVFVIVLLDLKWIRLFLNVAKTTGFTKDIDITNNSVEGWHHAFQSSVACHHPNIYKLIEHIQTEQDHTEQQIARFNAGSQTSVSSKNKYIQVTRRLTALLPTYGNRPLVQYLRGVAHNIEL